MKTTLLITLGLLSIAPAVTLSSTDSGTTNSGSYVASLTDHVGRGGGNGHRIVYFTFDLSTMPSTDELIGLDVSFSDDNATEGDETLTIDYLGSFSVGTVDQTNIATFEAGSATTVYSGAPGYGAESVSLSGLDTTNQYGVFRISNDSFTIGERFSVDSITLETGVPVVVPEPSSAALLGLGGLALLSRRKRS